MARKASLRKLEQTLTTDDIGEAFEAAMQLGDVWASPDGPAVVKDVDCLCAHLWRVTYRVIRVWGKEAW